MVNLKCAGCGKMWSQDKVPSKQFICPQCGAVNNVEWENAGTGDQAAGCLLPTTFEWKMPSGEFQTPFGLEYTTADGKRMTRIEWINDYGCDPKILYDNMRKYGKEGMPGFTNLSTLGRKK
jgi:phage FluMu protein Com